MTIRVVTKEFPPNCIVGDNPAKINNKLRKQMTGNDSVSRLSWIDNAKAIAIIAVIWMHVGNLIPAEYDILPKGLIISFNMHLFVFLSGLCALKGLTRLSSWQDVWNHIKKLCFRIGIPNLCFFVFDTCMRVRLVDETGEVVLSPLKFGVAVMSLLVICFGLLFAEKKKIVRIENVIAICVLILTLSGRVNAFWFLPFIMQTGIITVLTYFVANKYVHECVFSVLFFICMIIYPSRFHATMEMCTFYYVGLMMAKYNVYDRLKKSWKIAIILVAFAIYLSIYLNVEIEYNWYFHPAHMMITAGEPLQYLGRQVVAFALIAIATFAFFLLSKEETLFSRIGQQTLAIYPLHAIMITIIINNGLKQYVPMSVFSRPVIVLSLLLVTLGVIEFLNKNRLTRISFLGKYKLS